MRVALFTDRFAPGGGLSHLADVCAGLPGVAFAVAGASGSPRAEAPFRTLANATVFADRAPREVWRAFRPDIAHFHHLRPLLRGFALPCRRMATVHGVHLRQYDWRPGPAAAAGRFARLSLERFLYRRLDLVVAVSTEDAAYLRARHGVDRLAVAENGVDLDRFRRPSADRDTLRRRFGWPAGRPVALYVGRFEFPKGPDLLVEAARSLAASGRAGGAIFACAGDGSLLEPARALVRAAGLADRIRFLGARDDPADLYAAADLLVMPSRWEGMPLVLLEALAAGLPAVAADAPGIREVARRAGGNVALHRAGDPAALADAIAGALGRPFAPFDLRRFDRRRMTERIGRLYARLLAG